MADSPDLPEYTIPPLRLKELANADRPTCLLYLPPSTSIRNILACLKRHQLSWSIWEQCEHTLVLLGKDKQPLEDMDKSLTDYDIQGHEDIFFVTVRKTRRPQPPQMDSDDPQMLFWSNLYRGKTMTLHMKLLSAETRELTVCTNHNLGTIMGLIEYMWHIPAQDQRIIYGGKQVSTESWKTLEEFGIGDGTTLYLVYRIPPWDGPCICWALKEYIRDQTLPRYGVTNKMLADPVVEHAIRLGPPPPYESRAPSIAMNDE